MGRVRLLRKVKIWCYDYARKTWMITVFITNQNTNFEFLRDTKEGPLSELQIIMEEAAKFRM